MEIIQINTKEIMQINTKEIMQINTKEIMQTNTKDIMQINTKDIIQMINIDKNQNFIAKMNFLFKVVKTNIVGIIIVLQLVRVRNKKMINILINIVFN